MDRDELIARAKALLALVRSDGWTPEREDMCTDLLSAILAALESRPAPTEERAQATLEQWMGGDHIPTRAQIIAAMIDFATNTTPSRDEEGSVAVPREIWLEAHETIPRDGEDAAFAALGRILEITSRALKTSTPETQTVEGGGQ